MLLACVYSNSTQASVPKDDPPKPKPWAEKWKMEFQEKVVYPLIGERVIKGTWYYSYKTKSFRIDREDGSTDRYCGLIFPFSKTPCRQVVSNDWR